MMKRRAFLQTTLAASCLPLTATRSATAAGDDSSRQFLEWRRYVLTSDAQRAIVSKFLQTAALPALERMNIGPVGVFTEIGDDASPSIFTLAPFDSLEQMISVNSQLADDQQFLDAATEYLSTDKQNPAYDRIENQLMITFSGYPRVKTPRSGDRIFEVRTYESHNESKAKLKVEMFNEAEFDIFDKVGLDGVFYGETLVGNNLPNLTYMLAYQDMAEHDRAWKAFGEHPDWHLLRERDRYQDTVSKIIKLFLQPTDYSQI